MVYLYHTPTPRLSNLYRRGQEDDKKERWWVTSGKLVLDIARSMSHSIHKICESSSQTKGWHSGGGWV